MEKMAMKADVQILQSFQRPLWLMFWMIPRGLRDVEK